MSKHITFWIDQRTREIYANSIPLFDLTPLERALLHYFIKNPETYLTKTSIIENVWPDHVYRDGVSDAALYQLVRTLRKKLKERTSSNHQYIRNWRGIPEGGYRFFPKGLQGITSTAKSSGVAR